MPKISELTGSTITSTSELAVVQAGATVKAAFGHTHAQADVTNLTAAVARLPAFVVKSSDQSNTSNTVLQDITDLGFTLAANTTYILRWFLSWNSAATTTGATWGMSGPASPTALAIAILGHNAASETLVTRIQPDYADTFLGGTGRPTTTVRLPLVFDVAVQNGVNAGVIIPRFRSEVSGSAVTVFAGSFGVMWQVP